MYVSDYETGLERLSELAKVPFADRNEAATRLELIDALLFDCLGWLRSDCSPEAYYDGDYSDYELGKPAVQLLVEAKREGKYFELPIGFASRVCKLSTLAEASADIAAAIDQALGYCHRRGIPLGCVANGHQVIAFVASRQDGVRPRDGHALVFSSLDDMVAHFRLLWDNMSKPAVAVLNLARTLRLDVAPPPPPPKLAQMIAGYPRIKVRSSLDTDLKILGELVLEDMVRQPGVEDEFLRECYKPSGALSQYAIISRRLIESRYSTALKDSLKISSLETVNPKGHKNGLGETVAPAAMAQRPIVLLGDVGVGKSIFIRNFVRREAREVLDKSIVLYFDFGKEPALSEGLEAFVLRRSQVQLLELGVDICDDSFVRGVYHGDLLRFSRGVYGPLRTSGPPKYLDHEISFLGEKIADRAAHLRASLQHIVSGRGKTIVIFLDNVDQRPFDFQERLYLIANSLAQSWPATVFVSLRPDTFYASQSNGALAAYLPRVFSISPPRLDIVIDARLAFATTLLARDRRLPSFPSGVQLGSENLAAYLLALRASLRENPALNSFIDNVSGGNVRVALSFLSAFVGSGHVDTQRVLSSLQSRGGYSVTFHEFVRAVIYGDYEYYLPAASPIANLFDITSDDGREHFLLPILLTFVERRGATGEEGFVSIAEIYAYVQSLGFAAVQIGSALDRGISKKLLQTTSLRADHPSTESCRITSIGAYTCRQLAGSFTYLDAVIVDTPIVLPEYRKKIVEARTLSERLSRAQHFLEYLDIQWNSLDGASAPFEWRQVSESAREEIVRVRSAVQSRF